MSDLNGLLERRDLLRVGSICVAATALPAGLFAPGHAAEKSPPREGQGKAKSVIFLWMAGGVTHIDSLDPKPDAPVEVRGVLGDIATSVPGTRLCETVPELAKIADRLAVLRSFSHDSQRPPDQPGLHLVGAQGEHDPALLGAQHRVARLAAPGAAESAAGIHRRAWNYAAGSAAVQLFRRRLAGEPVCPVSASAACRPSPILR